MEPNDVEWEKDYIVGLFRKQKALKSAKDLPSSSVPNLEDDDDVDNVVPPCPHSPRNDNGDSIFFSQPSVLQAQSDRLVSDISSLRSDVIQNFSDMFGQFYLLAKSVKCLGKKFDSMFPSRKKFVYVVSDDGIKIDDEEK